MNLFEYNYEDMVTSMMLGFHIKDAQDFQLFHEELKKIEAKFGQDNIPLSTVESTTFDDEPGPITEFETQ